MNKRHRLLAAIQHSNLKDGEFVIKIDGEYFVGNLTHFEYKSSVECYTTVKIEGTVKE